MKLAYRIGGNHWQDEKAFEHLLSVVARWRTSIDEIALFVDYSHHGYYPLEEYQALAPVLQARMAALRRAGVPSVGINVLCSIGHLDESFDWLTRPPFQTVVGHDGGTSTSCMCVRAPEYAPYMTEKYRILAGTKPDFIWVDDDLRTRHHGVEYPCFCHRCVELFNRRVGGGYRRETLVRALERDTEGHLRRRFLEFNRDAMQDLLRLIRAAVKGVDPSIRLGFMTTYISLSGYDLGDEAGQLRALGADMVRPGGGFYTDERMMDMIDKAISVSFQNDQAEFVPDNQYELEDFPDCSRKSVSTHVLEFGTALMAGCNGIAVNSVVSPYMTDGIMDAIARVQPLWARLTAACEGTRLRGYYPLYRPDGDAAPGIRHSIFSDGLGSLFTSETALAKAGFAWTPRADGAALTAVSGDMLAALSVGEIKALFSRGVMMDMAALEVLETRGLCALAGCRPGAAFHSGIIERYTDHPLNGQSAGVTRNVYMSFWSRDEVTVRALEPLDGASVMSRLESVTGADCGAGSTIYENALGGRVAVMSYDPWSFLEVPGKRDSLPLVMDYLAYGRYPIMVEGAGRVIPMLRTGEGRFAAWLINASMDAAKGARVRLDAAFSSVSAWDMWGNEVSLSADAVTREGGFAYIALPEIKPWHALLLIGE